MCCRVQCSVAACVVTVGTTYCICLAWLGTKFVREALSQTRTVSKLREAQPNAFHGMTATIRIWWSLIRCAQIRLKHCGGAPHFQRSESALHVLDQLGAIPATVAVADHREDSHPALV
eukprot:gnl/TRDRNA2_/TRDRNA2_119002_c1_seq1.p3 gnl/TRDRNA2_/TRDRNA2_119002_c1~~gnl/TRDRNA2_/TRDRNA2_119002_c1_seq1.p3  ORF type:complete len:118 (-),score=7.72 gnl/TRDRNA2_/TRDRNA2_119002_c1_seq1:682-1035(-)